MRSLPYILSQIIWSSLIWVAGVTHLLGQAGQIPFYRLSVEDGLSQGSINCMMQDRKGFIWLGTADGLNRFNAYEFEVFRHSYENSGSISDNEITALTEDLSGNIWVGTGNGLNKYLIEEDRFIRYQTQDSLTKGNPKNHLSNNYITALLTDTQGTIWIGTKYGLNCYSPSDDKFIPYYKMIGSRPNLPQQVVRSIYETTKGDIWVGFDDELCLVQRAKERLISYKTIIGHTKTTQLNGSTVFTIWEDERNRLWVGTDAGLEYWDEQTQRFTLFPPTNGHIIKHILRGSEGKLWLGTSQGLLIYDEKENRLDTIKHRPAYSSSLSNDMVLSLLKDYHGAIWIGTATGLNMYTRYLAQFNTFRPSEGMNSAQISNKVWAITKDSQGWLWLGTEGGLYAIHEEKQSSKYYYVGQSQYPALKNDKISCIFEGANDQLWMGTYGGGLLQFDNKRDRFQSFLHDRNDTSTISANVVRAITQGPKPNTLWVGTNAGLDLFDIQKKSFTRILFHSRDGKNIKANSIIALLKDSQHMLWVGTEGGLLCYEHDKKIVDLFKHTPYQDNTISHDFVRAILEAKDGNLWIGTNGGLNHFSKMSKTFKAYQVKDGLPNNVVYAIEEGKPGNIWLTTNKGLTHFDTHLQHFQNYDAQDGLQGNEFNTHSSFKDAEGTLYFGGTKGINTFLPENIAPNLNSPTLTISHVNIVNRDSVQPTRLCILPMDSIELSYKDYLITFEFAALNYPNPYQTRYAYKLEGFDQNWNYAGMRRTATYTNIPGGSYYLKVKAFDSSGNPYEKLSSIHLQIRPPFWQTRLFWALVFVSTALGIYLIFVLRTRQILRKNIELKGLVDERTQSLQEQKIALERSLKQLKETQAQLLNADKMASLGQLTAGVAHEINNPVNFIYSGINSLRKNLSALMLVFNHYDEIDQSDQFSEAKQHIEELKEEFDMREVISDIDKLMIAIIDGAERTTEIVNSLRMFSRTDHAEMQFFNIYEGLKSTLRILHQRLGDSIELKTHYAPNMPEIECHPGQLNQVFLNILVNAIQAIGPDNPGRITITTLNHTHNIEISLQNDGPPIPEEIQKRIFEPFFTTKDVGKGTGLGLSISYAIINNHHGGIHVTSNVLEGTIFTIKLPKVQPHKLK